MKLFVIGKGRHGKDTFCEIARDLFGFTFQSSSMFMAKKLIYPKFKHDYKSFEECYADRHDRRKEWFDIICEYNNQDQSRLAREMFEEVDIYCGLRCKNQLKESKNLAHLTIWIDASDRLGDTEEDTSITVTKDDADIVIYNNGTLKEFEAKVCSLFALV